MNPRLWKRGEKFESLIGKEKVRVYIFGCNPSLGNISQNIIDEQSPEKMRKTAMA
jgi:hypothetical protein